MALAAVLMSGVCTSVAADEIIDRVLVVAAGDVIMQSDVAAARVLALVASRPADSDQDILDRLIDRSLMLAEVDRYGPPEPAADAIDRNVAAARMRFDTPSAFADALAKVGLTEADLRENRRQDLRIRAYLDERFTVAPPDEPDVAAYYQAHTAAFTRDGQPAPYDRVHDAVLEALIDERRRALVDAWVAGLRRRATITVGAVSGR